MTYDTVPADIRAAIDWLLFNYAQRGYLTRLEKVIGLIVLAEVEGRRWAPVVIEGGKQP